MSCCTMSDVDSCKTDFSLYPFFFYTYRPATLSEIIDPARSLRAQRGYEYNTIHIYIYSSAVCTLLRGGGGGAERRRGMNEIKK